MTPASDACRASAPGGRAELFPPLVAHVSLPRLDFEAEPGLWRSVGGYLREMHGERVYSIGIFTGGGEIADNGRDVRSADASFLVLRGNADATVTEWAGAPRPHLRMGIDPRELVPSEEFDALFYVDTATVPTYRIR